MHLNSYRKSMISIVLSTSIDIRVLFVSCTYVYYVLRQPTCLDHIIIIVRTAPNCLEKKHKTETKYIV